RSTKACTARRTDTPPAPARHARATNAYTSAMRPAAALLSCLLAACASTGGTMQTTAERVDSMMADYAGKVPGAALLVLRDGELVVRKGYGLADLEEGTPVTPETRFRLASVSKQFTAAAILLLVQD